MQRMRERTDRQPHPLALDEVRRICVQAVLGCAAAQHIELWRLTDIVQRRLDYDPTQRTVRFDAVLRELLAIERVTEEDLFIGLNNLIACLDEEGIRMEMPRLQLSEESRQLILQAGEAATHSARSSFELRRLRAAIHRVQRARLGTLLVNGHHITEEQLERALRAQERHGRRLGTNLVEMGFISAAGLARFLGHQLGLPCVTHIPSVEPHVLETIPRDVARRLRVFPLRIDETRRLEVAMEDPLDLDALHEIERLTGRVVRPYVAPETVLVYAMNRYFGHTQPARLRSG